MSYATRSDLRFSEELLAWLTTEQGGALPDDIQISAALSAADELINAHLRQRYTLPAPDPDRLLQRCAASLAREWLYRYSPRLTEVPAVVAAEAAEFKQLLKDLRDGRLSLAASTEDANANQEPSRPNVDGPARHFDRDTLDRW